MAIIKQAKNIITDIKNEHRIIAGKLEVIAEVVCIDSVKEDLSLNSNKKIVSNGNKQ